MLDSNPWRDPQDTAIETGSPLLRQIQASGAPQSKGLDRLWQWLQHSGHLDSWSIICACAIVLTAQYLRYHEAYLPWYPQSGWEVPVNWRPPPLSSLFYHYLAPYLKLIGLMGGVMFHLALIRSSAGVKRLIIPLWICCGFIAIWILMADFYEQWERVRYRTIGQPFSLYGYIGKAIALATIILSPAISVAYFSTRRLWERHVLSTIARPLAFCILAIATIVILADVEDNMSMYS